MLRAIVVDDHPTSRAFMDRMLRSEGIEPLLASNSAEALEAHQAAPIDLWFIDWMMPGMSGIDLVRAVRASHNGDLPYFIMQTAKNSQEDLAAAFDAGVDDFMSKPIGAMELFARLKSARRLVSLNSTLKQRLNSIESLNSELKSLNRRLVELADSDALTGLPNRRAGMSRLGHCWESALRYKHSLCVAMLDIDHFKRINDAFGHARGDAVIRHVAATLVEMLRSVDIPARIGGEEFMIVLPETPIVGAVICMERVRSHLERATCAANGKEVSLSVSIGVAERADAHATPDELIHAADMALYKAKELGRNRLIVAEPHVSGAAVSNAA